MPAGFDYPRGAEFWAPLAPGLAAASALWKTDALANVGVLFFVARLKDGVSVATAGADLSAIGRRLDEGRPGPQVGSQVALTPLVDHVVGPARPGPVGAARRGDGAAAHRLRQRVGPDADPGLPRSPRAGDPAGHGRLGPRAGAAVAGRGRCPRAAWWQCRHRAGRRAHQADARAGTRRHPAADRGGDEPPGRGHRADRHRAGGRGLRRRPGTPGARHAFARRPAADGADDGGGTADADARDARRRAGGDGRGPAGHGRTGDPQLPAAARARSRVRARRRALAAARSTAGADQRQRVDAPVDRQPRGARRRRGHRRRLPAAAGARADRPGHDRGARGAAGNPGASRRQSPAQLPGGHAGLFHGDADPAARRPPVHRRRSRRHRARGDRR